MLKIEYGYLLGENSKLKLNTYSTPKSRDPVKVHIAAENIKPASISEKGHTKLYVLVIITVTEIYVSY